MYVMHLWLSSVAHQAVMFSGFNKINIVRFQFWFAHIRNIILHKFLVDVLSKRDDKWVFFLGLLLSWEFCSLSVSRCYFLFLSAIRI